LYDILEKINLISISRGTKLFNYKNIATGSRQNKKHKNQLETEVMTLDVLSHHIVIVMWHISLTRDNF